uniref:Uncharacterized protein n=1 Tax=uncultured Helicobacter sp. TaxID=175537 RepID=A0A650EKP5_9HELI|nr:hypothetical protein Helico5904_0090 [uncultured Helicobacter sp.]
MQDRIDMQALDKKLQGLKKIGIKEISKSTKLASSKIEDVLEKRFDNIDKVRAKGFINILEREYGIDLSDWILAYQEHTRKEDITNVSQVITKQNENEVAKAEAQSDSQSGDEAIKEQKMRENKVLDITLKTKPVTKSDSESYTWIYGILVLILLCLMGYFAYKAFIQDYQEPAIQNQYQKPSVAPSHTQEQEEEVQSQYEGMFFDVDALQQNNTSEEQNNTSSDVEIRSGETLVETPSEVDSQKTPAPQEEKQDTPTQAQDFGFFQTPSANEEKTDEITNSLNARTSNDNVLHIQSQGDLWLGVINLDTGSKEQFAYQSQYDIKLNGRILFVMGHSNFTLVLNGKDVEHGTKAPVRMYYDGSSVTEINYTKFKQLNGGLEW